MPGSCQSTTGKLAGAAPSNLVGPPGEPAAGGKAVATSKAPTGPGMPSLGWRLNNEQVANILTYVRNNWGNKAPAVSPETVGRIRSALHSGS